MVVVIQALVILFTGAMEGMFRPGLARIFATLSTGQKAEAVDRNIVKSES
jgi:simple sugar transport system permease protein